MKYFENVLICGSKSRSSSSFIVGMPAHDSCRIARCGFTHGIQIYRHGSSRSLPWNYGIRFVPQQEAWVVERMGRYKRTLKPVSWLRKNCSLLN